MPRKKLFYTHVFPYHIVARCNNKEWFSVSLEEVWRIFQFELREISQKYQFQVHAFVLMSNHYHLIGTCSEKYDLGFVMRVLQSKTSKAINSKSGRINHVYGSRYRASLITNEYYYANAWKYVYRNPVTALQCNKVSDWEFSTLNRINILPLSCHIFERTIFKRINYEQWLNTNFEEEAYQKIKIGLTRSEFKFKQIQSPLSELL